MSTIEDGGPAFSLNYMKPGMSLRDYFAAHAPPQIHDDASPEWASERADVPLPSDLGDQPALAEFWANCEAVLRYEHADAMLRARGEKT